MKTIEELQNKGVGDYYLVSITWLSDPYALKLSFAHRTEPADLGRETRDVVFVSPSNLKMELDFNKYNGVPFVFESQLTPLDNAKGWRFELFFDGTPLGQLCLTCSDVRVGL